MDPTLLTIRAIMSPSRAARYVGRGPLILLITSLKVVLADGSVVEASPAQNADIFNGVIGGYGGLGVITEATFELTENVKVKRQDRTMPSVECKRYFVNEVGGSSTAVLHNGDIYPNAFNTVHAVTYTKTDDPVTVADRLIPENKSYRLDRFLSWVSRTGLSGRSSGNICSIRSFFVASP